MQGRTPGSSPVDAGTVLGMRLSLRELQGLWCRHHHTVHSMGSFRRASPVVISAVLTTIPGKKRFVLCGPARMPNATSCSGAPMWRKLDASHMSHAAAHAGGVRPLPAGCQWVTWQLMHTVHMQAHGHRPTPVGTCSRAWRHGPWPKHCRAKRLHQMLTSEWFQMCMWNRLSTLMVATWHVHGNGAG